MIFFILGIFSISLVSAVPVTIRSYVNLTITDSSYGISGEGINFQKVYDSGAKS